MMKIKSGFFNLLFCVTLFFTSTSYASSKHYKAPFVIADLYGQLGNQMFQIATAMCLALDNNAEPIFPDLKTNTKYGIPENYQDIFYFFNASQRYPDVSHAYYEPSYSYSPIPYQPCMKIGGYFQSWKYFDHHRDFIQKIFTPKESILTYLLNKYSDIILDPKTVSIHVRTYNKDDPNNDVYPFNGIEYVREAMQLFPQDSHYIVFSDDIAWCKDNLKGLAPQMRFIEGEAYIHDFFLQSMCCHHIISNSSFSWWAAYLNPNASKVVVAPGRWFQPSTGLTIDDLIPPDWHIINN